jgi:peptidoglycan/LPS O-acetylase OafA/YrhL
MRFVLAVYLMVFHTIHAYPQANRLPFVWLADLGGFSTSTFFILSGFILTHVYVERSPSLRGGTHDFLVKRFSEIYPIHLIGLLLFVLVLSMSTRAFDSFFLPSLGRGEQQAVRLTGGLAAFNWLLNIAMVQVWYPRYSSINPPSWSLGCLLFFYVSFPLLGPRLANMRRRAAALVAVWLLYLIPPVTVVLLGAYGPLAVGAVEHNPVLRIPEFMSGILLYNLYSSGGLKWLLGSRWRKAVAAAFVLVSFVLASYLIENGPLYFLYIVHNGALMPTELVLVALCADACVPKFAQRITSRLGNAALSIFGIHGAIFAIAIKALKLMTIHKPISECVSHFSACAAAAKGLDPSMATYPLYLVFTVIAAVLFQEHCFVPLRTAIRRTFVKHDRRLVERPGLANV